ncbi:TPA: ATP-grasp domain-containing protein [Legionella pneumophila]
MQTTRVLLIGVPFSYKLVDYKLLKSERIEPVLSYLKGTQPISSGISAYYEALCFDEIAQIIEDYSIKYIVCFNDNFLIQAGQLRSRYGLPGIGYPEINKFKVKSEMYKMLSPYLSTPKTIHYRHDFSFKNISEILGVGEYFIKPDNLAGSEGSCHIRNTEDYHYWQQLNNNSGNHFLIQRYYSEPLYHCELVVRHNEIRYIQARRYSYPNHRFLEGKIIASFPIQDIALRQLIEQQSIIVQQHLGLKNGIMHTEFFVGTDCKPVFLETNIRPAGGAINLVHKRRAGISLETLMILLELDRDFDISVEDRQLFDLCGYIPLKQGRVTNIVIPELKGIYDFDIRVQLGMNYQAPTSASNTAVAFVGFSPVYNDLEDDFIFLEDKEPIIYSQNLN